MRIALVVSEFNYDITSLMLERAQTHANVLGLEVSHIVRVPGVFDMGPVVKRLLRRDDVDGVVVIGAVIKGETKHDEAIMSAVTKVVADLAAEFEKPVGLGVTGPGMDRLQALERIDNAKNAVESVARVIAALKALDK